MGSVIIKPKDSNNVSFQPRCLLSLDQLLNNTCLGRKIPSKFFDRQLNELDIIASCHYFQKAGLKPVKNLPIHEICFGIEEILCFVDCFTINIAKMKNLKKLSMHWNILSYQDLENDFTRLHNKVNRLVNFLGKLKSLEHLVFKISRNQPKALLSLFNTVVKKKQMKKIDFELQASKFQQNDVLRITELLKEAKNLQELNLSFKRCLLSEDAFSVLFDCLDKLRSLKKLRLNFAFMSNIQEEQINRIVKVPEKLLCLDFFSVNMTGTDLEDRHVKRMMKTFSKSSLLNKCYVKVGFCKKVSFLISYQTKSFEKCHINSK